MWPSRAMWRAPLARSGCTCWRDTSSRAKARRCKSSGDGWLPIAILDVDGQTIVFEFWSGEDWMPTGRDRRLNPLHIPTSASVPGEPDTHALSAPQKRIRIVLADDAVLLREALAAALAAAGFEVVGQADDVPGLLALVEREQPGPRRRRRPDAADHTRPRASRRPAGSGRTTRPSRSSSSRNTSRLATRST